MVETRMTWENVCRRANLCTYSPSFLKGMRPWCPRRQPRGDTQAADCSASLRQPAGLSVRQTEQRGREELHYPQATLCRMAGSRLRNLGVGHHSLAWPLFPWTPNNQFFLFLALECCSFPKHQAATPWQYLFPVTLRVVSAKDWTKPMRWMNLFTCNWFYRVLPLSPF